MTWEPPAELTGQQALEYFLQQHDDGLHNRKIRRTLLSHVWRLAQIPVEQLPDWEDPRFTEDDPYGRALDNSPLHVDRLVELIQSGREVAPVIADASTVFLDGNHRALASRIAGKPVKAYVPK